MKLSIEADSESEVRAKAPELLARLAKALHAHAPELADILEKASTERREPELKHEALRDLFARTHKGYADMLDVMLAEIGQALEAHVDEVKKSAPDYTSGIVHMEDAAYEKVRNSLAVFGFGAEDFDDESGKLYGFSTNELRDLLAALQKQKAG